MRSILLKGGIMNEVIAVVDDEEDILNLVAIHLEKEKFRPVKFSSAFPFKAWLMKIKPPRT